MAGPCDIPGVSNLCDAAGDVAGDAAGGVFDAMVGKLAEGFAKAVQMVVTFWTPTDVNSSS